MSTTTTVQAATNSPFVTMLDHPVCSLVKKMLDSGFYPAEEIKEWEEVFFAKNIQMSNQDMLVLLLTQWILPEGDEEAEKGVRRLLGLPKETVDRLIAEHEKAILLKEAREKNQNFPKECLKDRAAMAQALNQKLASHYQAEAATISSLIDEIQEKSEERTEDLTEKEKSVKEKEQTVQAKGQSVISLLGKRTELQDQRRSMLGQAKKGLEQ